MPAFVVGLGHGQRRLDGHARRLEVAVPPLDTPADLLAALRDADAMIQRIDADLEEVVERRPFPRTVVLALLLEALLLGFCRGATRLFKFFRGGLACVTNSVRTASKSTKKPLSWK